MSEMPDEQQVTHYLDMGLQLIPAGDSEAAVCLLTAKAFMPWAFPATANNATEAAALEAGSAAADTALRLRRPDLASAALDGVDSVLMMQERFADAKAVSDRRQQLLDRINDPLEVGDVYALSAWVRFDLGLYAEAAESATEGRERAAGAPAMVVHCQAWCALSWFRLGRWQDFVEGIALLEQMLGDRRTDPPYFALRPFGAAAFVCEARGERGTADRFLAVVERSIRENRAGETMAVALASLVRSRRGEFDAAWRLSDLLLPKPRGHIPIVWETRCDLVADTGSWHRATETLGSAREAADRGQLVALPAFADRLKGRAALAGNDAESAIMPLTEARNRFEEIGARWERAYTELSLGEALIRAGKEKQGRLELHRALTVFDQLHSVREAERAKQLLG
jgi:hypothetical protein